MNGPNSTLRSRFWLQTGCSLLALALAILTLVSREWIELLTGRDPDSGDGTFEWVLVTGLALVAVTCGIAARVEWLRPRGAGAQS